jgi:hypothetical protein
MEHFTRLNSAVFLHEPTHGKVPNAPDLILIAGWMNASMRNLAKYTAGYEKLYPSARIVVITTSTVNAAFTTHTANLNRIAPALEIVYGLPPDAKILLHFFSNGGGWTTTLVADTYQAKTDKPLPASAMVLDSTPGKNTYTATVAAFAVGLPKNILLQMVGTWILKMCWLLYRLAYLIGRNDDLIMRTRKGLNNEALFDVKTPRLYIYSDADPFVAWEFVEEHAQEAKETGYSVSKERFVESGHCFHLPLDENRYWAAVTSLWSTVSHLTDFINGASA